MEDPDFLVETLTAQHPDGTRSEIVIRLGKPVPLAENPDTYVCRLHIEGIRDQPRPDGVRVYGGGPLQALHLTMVTLRTDLEIFEENSGARMVFPGTGEPHDWRRFWFYHPT
jgi:hypothetical protein